MKYRVLLPFAFGLLILFLSLVSLWGIQRSVFPIQEGFSQLQKLYLAKMVLQRLKAQLLEGIVWKKQGEVPQGVFQGAKEDLKKLSRLHPLLGEKISKVWRNWQQGKTRSLASLLRPFQEADYLLEQELEKKQRLFEKRFLWHYLPILFALGSISLLIWVVTYLLTRVFLSPIEKLEQAIQEVKKGNLHPQVSFSGNHELALLGKSFLQMAEELSQSLVSKSYLEGILHSLPGGVLILDAKGVILEANPAACQIFQKKREELVGKEVQCFFESIPLSPFSGKRLVVKGGKVYLWASLSPLKGAESPQWVLAVQNITDLVRLEEKLVHLSDELQCQIGRDVHDSLGQNFTGIKFLSETLLREKGLPSSVRKELEQIRELALEGIQQSRHLAHLLNPVTLSGESLREVLEGLLERSRKIYHIEGECRGEDLLLSGRKILELYRIAQEAIQNGCKHGGATRFLFEICCQNHQAGLIIEDNGKGMGESLTQGMGMVTMECRARSLGGRLEVKSSQLGGVRLEVWFPYEKREEKDSGFDCGRPCGGEASVN